MTYHTGMTANSTEVAALAINGSQPVWMTLNEAREHAFTGELVFEADPEVYAYLDNGIVYYAERISDDPLGRRLLEAGLLDMIQLERGTVRVGDIEHLGRLFDRDPSIDRDTVVVFSEASTEELITDLANRAVTTVRVTAYRHHPSGLHRWFVAPRETVAVARPFSAITQLDTTMVDQLPGLPFGSAVEELTIEWDDLSGGANDISTADDDDTSRLDELGAHVDFAELDSTTFDLSLEVPDFSDDGNPATIAIVDIEIVHVEIVDVESIDVDSIDVDLINVRDDLDDFEFSVVWPDDPDELSAELAEFVDDEAPVDDMNERDVDGVEPAFTHGDDGEFQFVMPPLMLSDEPDVADADVPDDVADAVRRAIAAIESASAPAPAPTVETVELAAEAVQTSETVDLQTVDLDDREIDEITHVEDIEVDNDELIEPDGQVDAEPAAFGTFAPPTPATSAELMYEQLIADNAKAGLSMVDTSTPAGGANQPLDGDSGDRNTALRRLIGGLRRNDH